MAITATPSKSSCLSKPSSGAAKASQGQSLGKAKRLSSSSGKQGIAAGGGGCVRRGPPGRNPLKYKDASAGEAIRDLPRRPAYIEGHELGEALIKGVQDKDARGASTEYGDFKRFVNENWDRMSPDAKAKWRTYEKHAISAQAEGKSGLASFDDIAQEIRSSRNLGTYDVDDSSALALHKLEAKRGDFTNAECEQVFDQLLQNHGNQPYGAMYDAVAEFADRNWHRLPADMKVAFKAYQGEALRARSQGDTFTSPFELQQMFGSINDSLDLHRLTQQNLAMQMLRRL